MQTRRSILVLLIALQASTVAAQTVELFRSPAVNRRVYRDDQVRRLTGTFKDWQASCDEILDLKQRYCSLFNQARSTDGKTSVEVVVTTTDDGKPAAMLQLPLGLRLSSDIEVTTTRMVPADGKATRQDAATRLRVVSCGPSSCMALWKLTVAQIASLNGAGSLKVRVRAPQARFLWPAVPQRNTDRPIDVFVSSAGFKDAMVATQSEVVR